MSAGDLFAGAEADAPSAAELAERDEPAIDDSAVVIRSQPEIEVYPNRYGHVVIKMAEDGAFGEEQVIWIQPVFVDAVIAALRWVKAQIAEDQR